MDKMTPKNTGGRSSGHSWGKQPHSTSRGLMSEKALAMATKHFMKAHHVKKQPAKLGGQGSSRFLNIGNSIDALNSGREGTSSPLVLMSPSRISPPPPVENVLLGTAGAAEGGGGGGGEGAAVTALTGVADAAGSAGTTLLATAAAAAGEVAKGASVPVPSQKDFFADVQEQLPLLDADDDGTTTSDFIRKGEGMFDQIPDQPTMENQQPMLNRNRKSSLLQTVGLRVGVGHAIGTMRETYMEGEGEDNLFEEEEEEEDTSHVKYGRFSIKTGTPDARSDLPKSICFIPEGKSNKNEHYPDLVKKIWGMGEANMILKLCAGSRHPKSLVNSLLADTPGFQDCKKDANLQVKRKQKLLEKRLYKPLMKVRPNQNNQNQDTHSQLQLQSPPPHPPSGHDDDFDADVEIDSHHNTNSDRTLWSAFRLGNGHKLHTLGSGLKAFKAASSEVGSKSGTSRLGNSEYDAFRVDESGFSSGDSSSNSDSLSSSSSDSSTDLEHQIRRKKRKKFRPPVRLVVEDMDDDDNDMLGVDVGGELLPFSIRKALIAETRDKTNIEAIMSKMLFERLVSCFVTIVESSAQAKNWILVDRTDPDHSPTAELLLEYALQRTNATPIIIVIDSLSRFLGAPETNTAAHTQGNMLLKMRYDDTMKKVEDKHTATAADPLACPDVQMEAIPGYLTENFDNWRDFYHEAPLPFDPHEHNKQFANGDIHPKSLWSLYYKSTLFSSGSHYVIVDERGYNFSRSELGSTGYVFANGGNSEYKLTRSCIRNGNPSVMLMNSGSVAQAFCSLRAGMQWKKNSKSENPDHASEAEMNSSIMASLQVLQHEDKWAYKFGMSDIDLCNDILMRSPNLFETYIVSADVISLSTEDFFHIMTEVFANGGKTGIPELGVGNAEELVVFNAWERQNVMYDNHTKHFRYERFMYAILAVIALLTTLTSVVYSNLSDSWNVTARQELLDQSCPGYVADDGPASCDKLYSHRQEAEDMVIYGNVLQNLIVMLPIMAGFIGAIIARNAFENKWKVSYLTALQLCSEIFMFRSKVGNYRDVTSEEINRAIKEGQKNVQRDERDIFVMRIQGIFGAAMNTEVGRNGSLRFAGVSQPSALVAQSDEKYNLNERKVHIQRYLNREIYRGHCPVQGDGISSATIDKRKNGKGKGKNGKAIRKNGKKHAEQELSAKANPFKRFFRRLQGKEKAKDKHVNTTKKKHKHYEHNKRARRKTKALRYAQKLERKQPLFGTGDSAVKKMFQAAGIGKDAVDGVPRAEISISKRWKQVKKAKNDVVAKIHPQETGKVRHLATLVNVTTSENQISKRRMRHIVQKQEIEDHLYDFEGGTDMKEINKKKLQQDTVFGPLNIDTYIATRLIPLLNLYKDEAPEINAIFTWLELVSFSFTSFGALLAVVNLAQWVAITVAIAAALQSFVEKSGMRLRRDTVNKNIAALHNLLTWWDSLTIVQRRTLAAREKIVLTTEDCVLDLAEAQTGKKRYEMENFEKSEDHNGKDQSKSKQHGAGEEKNDEEKEKKNG